MNATEYYMAIRHIQGDKKFPHGVFPGQTPAQMTNPAKNQQTWENYQWDPPQYYRSGAYMAWTPLIAKQVEVTGVVYQPNENDWPIFDMPPMVDMELKTIYSTDTTPTELVQPPEEMDSLHATSGVLERHSVLTVHANWDDLPAGWSYQEPTEFPAFASCRWVSRIPDALVITSTDPDAMEKPTWSELVSALGQCNQWSDYWKTLVSSDMEEAIKLFREINPGNVLKNDEIGSIRGNVEGLLNAWFLATQTDVMPVMHLRNESHGCRKVYKRSEMLQILEEMAIKHNKARCAHNDTYYQYVELESNRDNEELAIDKRLDSAMQTKQFIEEYSARMSRQLAVYDPEALPDDVDECKAILKERLEGLALKKSRKFLGVLTDQGMALYPATEYEANGLRGITIMQRNGSRAIDQATDKQQAVSAYKTWSHHLK